MKKLAVLAVAGLVSVTANASNWVMTHKNSEFSQSIDIDSISRTGRYATAFVEQVYHSDQDYLFSKKYNRMLYFNRYDCESNPKKSQMLSNVTYKDELVLFTSDIDFNADWNVVYPDTLGETAATIACLYKK